MDIRLRECELVYRPTSDKAPKPILVRSSECVHRLFAAERYRAHESVWVVLLDARSHVIATHEVARGGVTSVQLEPACIFRAAIVAGAPSLLLVHNHPSGDPKPSAEDITFTKQIAEGATLLGLHLLDHVVIAHQGYVSLLDTGVLPRTSRREG